MLRPVHPDRFRYSAENCSIRRTLDVVGEKWTLLVLREAFLGVRRFDDEIARRTACVESRELGFRCGFGGSRWSHDYPAADFYISDALDTLTRTRVSTDRTNVLDLEDDRTTAVRA